MYKLAHQGFLILSAKKYNCIFAPQFRIMEKFVGFFRSLTYLAFMGALLWSYAYMVGQVDYGLGTDTNPSDLIDKDVYFFSAIAVFLLINLILGWFIKSLKKIKSVEGRRGLQNRAFRLDIIVWVKGLAAVLNLMMGLVLFFVGLMNLTESRDAMTLDFYIYLGPLMLVVWIIYLVVLLLKKRS